MWKNDKHNNAVQTVIILYMSVFGDERHNNILDYLCNFLIAEK